MKHLGLLLSAILLVALGSARASITEVRMDFFNQTANLHATAIMSAPTGDASYLISVYESTQSCTVVPVLRWRDENGVAQSQRGSVGAGSGSCYLSLLANIRVQAKSKPTIETVGDSGGSNYSLYVSGLGFWPSGVQGQGGLAEVSGSLPTVNLVYALPVYQPAGSTDALLISYSNGSIGQNAPYVTWTDEYSTHSQTVAVGQSAVVPVRVAAGTKVWIETYPEDTTWYALVVFGEPAAGSGPFGDYEANLLDWSNATYPNWQTVFRAGGAGANVLVMGDVTEAKNGGTVSEGLQIYWAQAATGACSAALVGGPSGKPASCVSAAFVGMNSPVEFRTYNTSGSLWGMSPTYSAEVDVLEF
jgi:hypothetical protein